MIGEMNHMYQTDIHNDFFFLIWEELIYFPNTHHVYDLRCQYIMLSTESIFCWHECIALLSQFSSVEIVLISYSGRKICFGHVASRDQIIFRCIINLSQFPNQKYSLIPTQRAKSAHLDPWQWSYKCVCGGRKGATKWYKSAKSCHPYLC